MTLNENQTIVSFLSEIPTGNIKEQSHIQVPVRLSDRLNRILPISGKQLFFRRAIEILHLILNSPNRKEILDYFGFDETLLFFNLNTASEKFGKGFIQNEFKAESQSLNSDKQCAQLKEEIVQLKLQLEKQKKGISIFNRIFSALNKIITTKMNLAMKEKSAIKDALISFNTDYRPILPSKEEQQLLKELTEGL